MSRVSEVTEKEETEEDVASEHSDGTVKRRRRRMSTVSAAQ